MIKFLAKGQWAVRPPECRGLKSQVGLWDGRCRVLDYPLPRLDRVERVQWFNPRVMDNQPELKVKLGPRSRLAVLGILVPRKALDHHPRPWEGSMKAGH